MSVRVDSPAPAWSKGVTFAQKLQSLLDAKGWSVNELARQSSVPYSTLKSYFQRRKKAGKESAQLPTFASVVAICKALEVPIDSFRDCSDWNK